MNKHQWKNPSLKVLKKELIEEKEEEVEDTDCEINEMSLMDLAAIIWQKPVAGHEFLNKAIRETFKQ